ncbi:LysR substrate-binding domain-containing protein [Paenalcaligenes niemegkensis]|uniref:LysR substrate-binding domain-containing protein n=1 Tax=Paenalcaligenes niemegkensis TaxID=2895469 RepID=UPI001EE8FDD4|nr:LysR substrate-binding domain-containing protein [Paenalcaligenes niemegkensis]MCQ9616182.1 LysR substrate-binding domain-containing protein [Paenalcaligenes niemegkensis]
MPRLVNFQTTYPHIELKIEAEDSSRALLPGTFDLAIDLNDGVQSGLQITPLIKEEIFPVCSPSLLIDNKLEKPEDLRAFPLLHDITAWRGSHPYAEWEGYLAAIGATGIDVRRGYMFNRNHVVIQAAIAGMGVAIARKTLSTHELRSGQLVAPFSQRVETSMEYGIAYSPGALDDRRIKAVHDWIVDQASQST